MMRQKKRIYIRPLPSFDLNAMVCWSVGRNSTRYPLVCQAIFPNDKFWIVMNRFNRGGELAVFEEFDYDYPEKIKPLLSMKEIEGYKFQQFADPKYGNKKKIMWVGELVE